MSKKSRKRKGRERGIMPLTGAGLVRFFEEEVKGIQLTPQVIIGLSLALILSALMAHLLVSLP